MLDIRTNATHRPSKTHVQGACQYMSGFKRIFLEL